MTDYRVYRKAEVWFLTYVEADSEEEAIELAKDENAYDWEPEIDHVFLDEYEAYEK